MIGKAPLYVHRTVEPESAAALKDWAIENGIASMVPVEKLHMTVAFSKAKVDFKPLVADTRQLMVSFERIKFLGSDDEKVLTILVKPYDYLEKRWQYYRDQGASWDHGDYTPHVSITWEQVDPKQKFKAPDFQIRLGPEIIEEAKSGWSDDELEIKLQERLRFTRHAFRSIL
jgi:hypothetical protein